MDWDDITSRIFCDRKPFAFAWDYKETQHLMMVVGYSNWTGETELLVYDPSPEVGYTHVPRADYLGGVDHQLAFTYADVEKQ